MIRNNPYHATIEACQNCAIACEYAINLAIERRLEAVGALRDCATLCHTAVALLSRESAYAPRACSLVADICRICTQALQSEDHEHFGACADACRRCARFCDSARARDSAGERIEFASAY